MEQKFDLSSPEYRSAWAKTMMGLSDDKFTEDEKRKNMVVGSPFLRYVGDFCLRQ